MLVHETTDNFRSGAIAKKQTVSSKTLNRKVKVFVAAAMNVACALNLDSAPLKEELGTIAKQVIEVYKPALRGKKVEMAGIAAALLCFRQKSKPVTMADVCRVGQVKEKVLNEAYQKLVAILKPVVPAVTVKQFVARFRDAAIGLVTAKLLTKGEDDGAGHWAGILTYTDKVLQVVERVWAASGRQPMVVAGAAVVVAVRMHAHRRAMDSSKRSIDVMSVLMCDIPTIATCCEEIAKVAFVPARGMVNMHRKLARPIVEALERVLPAGSDPKHSDLHEHIHTLHAALFGKDANANAEAEVPSASSSITSGILPEARRAIDSKVDKRRDLLRKVRGGISKSSSRTKAGDEVKAIAGLVEAGVPDEAILSGYYDSVRRQDKDTESGSTLASENLEKIDSYDSDVDSMMNTAEEIAALAAARNWK